MLAAGRLPSPNEPSPIFFSSEIWSNGSSASPADASQYLLTMPGIQEGFASCTSRPDLAIAEPPARSAVPLEQPLQEQLQRGASACPFSIQTSPTECDTTAPRMDMGRAKLFRCFRTCSSEVN